MTVNTSGGIIALTEAHLT